MKNIQNNYEYSINMKETVVIMMQVIVEKNIRTKYISYYK